MIHTRRRLHRVYLLFWTRSSSRAVDTQASRRCCGYEARSGQGRPVPYRGSCHRGRPTVCSLYKNKLDSLLNLNSIPPFLQYSVFSALFLLSLFLFMHTYERSSRAFDLDTLSLPLRRTGDLLLLVGERLLLLGELAPDF